MKKTQFVRDLLCSLRKTGSRFLKVIDDKKGVEIGDEVAVRSVVQAFNIFKKMDEEVEVVKK